MTTDRAASEDRERDLWLVVPRLLDGLAYCVLSTADADGTPWATPVFFAAPGHRELYWVSSADSRHSQNISVRPQVAIAVFDSTVPVGRAEAVYLTARARVGADVGAALAALNRRLPPRQALGLEDLAPRGPLTPYQATVTRYEILVRGGDPTFGNVVDSRHPVTPPA